jgi:iron complex transport system substrate-binding protein
VVLAAVLLLAVLWVASSARPGIVGRLRPGQTQVLGLAFPKRLVDRSGPSDPSGLVFDVKMPPRRIASTVLMTDELLTALAPSRLVAVTPLADQPGISNVAGLVPPSARRVGTDLESVLATEPDLVLVAGYSPTEMVGLLSSLHIPVVRISRYDSFADVIATTLLVGAAIGAEREAETLVNDLGQRIAKVQAQVAGHPRPLTLYYSHGYTSGPRTLIDEMITTAGGVNAAAALGITGPAPLPVESALTLAPDVILVSAWPKGPERARNEVLSDPLWRDVPAVKNGRVCAIAGAHLTTVSHYAVLGLEEVLRCLHQDSRS